ncbi:phage tail-collar fiber domain-containing protein [Lachnospiraceae bacterium HCP1S3_A10]
MKEYLTDAGRDMLAGMLAGEYTIRYTKVEMGDGALSTSQHYKKMTALVNTIASLDVDSVVVTPDNIVKIAAVFSNKELTSGFYYREKGIFATDGKNEVLFAYANSGSDAEWIEPPTVEIIEKKIMSLYKEFQDTETDLKIQIKSGIYVSTDDFNAALNELEGKYAKKDLYDDTTINVGRKAGTEIGSNSTSEGSETIAAGYCSHAEGEGSSADSACQHVEGKYNISDVSHKYAHIIGNGNSDRERSNAHTVDWEGNAWYSGDVCNGNGVSLDGLNTNMSDVWNSSVTYGVNSYCIYNNKLWKCKVQHKNQPPTEGTYWTACTISGEISELNSNLDILLSITTNNFDYVANFSSKENADNAPQGIRKGQAIIGHPSRFEEWVMYQTYYYDANHQYGWQLAFNMNGNGIAYRYRRNSTWNDWAYLVLES